MAGERLEIDHLVLGVDDLDAAADVLLDRHGLVALPGGRHPAWGTANRVVPLGPTYLELVTVVDPVVAAGSAFGSWVADMAAARSGWGWAVRTHAMRTTAARLGLEIVPGSRVAPDGTRLRWRLAGVPTVGSDRTLPFFISWDEGTPLPGSVRADHRVSGVRLAALTVETDPDRLARWLGASAQPAHALPVDAQPADVLSSGVALDMVPGDRGIVALDIRTDSGVIRLAPPS